MSLVEVFEDALGFRAGYTPAAQIMLDGMDITANLIPASFPLAGGGVGLIASALGLFLQGGPLLSLTVTDNEGVKSDSVELEIDNRDRLAAPQKGAKLDVSLGYVETGLVPMGQFQVDTWRKKGKPRTMTISAKAVGLTTDIKSPKSRSYHDTTVGEIVEKVAGKNSLTAMVHPELKDTKIGHIDQSNESDVNFLTRLASRVGGIFKLANGNVVMNLAGSGTLPGGGEAPVFDWSEVGAKDWSAEGSERGSYGSASASYTDDEEGERKEESEGEGTPKHRDRRLYKTKDEAKTAAKAKLGQLNRGKVTYTREMPGAPEVFSGARGNVYDHDPDVDGLYQVKTATHKLAASGFDTSVNCESTNESGGSGSFLTGSGKESGADA